MKLLRVNANHNEENLIFSLLRWFNYFLTNNYMEILTCREPWRCTAALFLFFVAVLARRFSLLKCCWLKHNLLQPLFLQRCLHYKVQARHNRRYIVVVLIIDIVIITIDILMFLLLVLLLLSVLSFLLLCY